MNSTKDMDIYLYTSHSIEGLKVATFKFQLNAKPVGVENSSIDFFKNFKTISQKRPYSDFSIDRFITNNHTFKIDNRRIDKIEGLIKQLKTSIENHQFVIDKSFTNIENQINSTYQIILDQIMESRSRLFNELSKISQICSANVNLQSTDWQSVTDFIKNHQIDTKTIEFYLNQPKTEQKSINELKRFETSLEQKRAKFNSLILMNKTIQFTPGFLSKDYQNSIQNGFVKFIKTMGNNNGQSEANSQLIERLEEFFFFKSLAKSLNCLTIKQKNESSIFMNASIHSIHRDQRILLTSNSTNTSNLHMVDAFGKIVNQISILNSQFISTNSMYICVGTENGCHGFLLTIYNSNLIPIKQRIVRYKPIASFFSEDYVYIMSNSMPYLQIYDKSLDDLKNMSPKFYHEPTGNVKFSILNEKMFLMENDSSLSTQIIISTVYSGIVLKKVSVPFCFTDYKVISSDLIMFLNNFSMIFYDLSKECVKYNVKLSRQENFGNESKSSLSFCVTDRGLVLTIEKNQINIY